MQKLDRAKRAKRTEKQPHDSPSKKIESAMGCGPSQAVIIQSPPDRNPPLQPTLFMVAEESFKMLRELGELKFYHLAQYGDSDEAEDLHRDFAARLENPVEYVRSEKIRSHENDNGKPSVRCMDNTKTDRIVSRVSRVKESKTLIQTYTNDLQTPSPSKGPDFAARGTTGSTCLGELFENPSKFQGTSANFRDVNPTKFSDEKANEIQMHGTPETRPKPKTFFGRNRVKPEHSSVASRYDFSTSSNNATSRTPQTNLTKLGKLTIKDVNPERSLSDPCISSSQNLNP